MHRQTGSAAGFRGYSGGGGRALIKNVDDASGMQTMNGTGMKGEAFSASKDGSFKGPESPQNYGFTSVIADASKDAAGAMGMTAEGFMSFMGGNRAFPVCSIMDDVRNRLLNLGKDAAKGAVGMHGLKDWGQQFLNTEAGMFMTGNMEKKIRTALVQNQNKQQSKSGGGGSGGSGGSARSSGGGFSTLIVNGMSGKDTSPFAINGFSDDVSARMIAGMSGKVGISALADGGGSGGGSGGSGSSGGKEGGGKKYGQKTLHKEKSDTYHEIDKDNHLLVRGKGNVQVKDKRITTHYEDVKKSTLCDDQHVHTRYQGSQVWVDKDGCWSSKPIQIRKCRDDESNTSSLRAIMTGDPQPGPIESGPPAYFYEDPLVIDPAAKITLKYKAPLFVDTDGKLTSTGGGVGGVPEAPTDGRFFVRGNGLWNDAALYYQPLDGDLTALAALTGTAIYYRSATNVWSPVVIGANLTFTGGTLAATAGGNVSNTGTPTAGQLARWTDGTHIEGFNSPYALIESPTFTGNPQAPTPLLTDNDTSLATTAYVKAQGYLVTSDLAGKEDKANKGVANGYASLDATTKVPASQLPSYGTMAAQNASAVAITGGTIDGIVLDGGSF